MKKFLIYFIFLFFAFTGFSFAQEFDNKEELMEATVLEVLSEGTEDLGGANLQYQDLKVSFTRGSLKDHHVQIKNVSELDKFQEYQEGDSLRIHSSYNFDEERQFVVEGKVKRNSLLALTIIFIFVVLMVGRKWGFLSLLGLSISFFLIFKLALPLIISGVDPILVAFMTALIIIPSTFYVSHGINKKTHVAVIATFISLLFTIFLAFYFVNRASLTGFSTEEANFVAFISEGKIDIFSLMLAGIIISVLGILDDITVGQASVVKQLKKNNPKISKSELFKQGMAIGQDHISSMVNTLVLVYAGSALPLLLLFFDADKTFVDVIELEIVAEEIIKTLVGSIGLVMAAPLATALAVFFFDKTDKKE